MCICFLPWVLPRRRTFNPTPRIIHPRRRDPLHSSGQSQQGGTDIVPVYTPFDEGRGVDALVLVPPGEIPQLERVEASLKKPASVPGANWNLESNMAKDPGTETLQSTNIDDKVCSQFPCVVLSENNHER